MNQRPCSGRDTRDAARLARVLEHRGFVFGELRFHAFFGGLAARFIGWADSPFQFEVATASLGFAAVGFLAAWRSFDLRLAAVVGPALFTLGAAAGHVYQMVTANNFAPGNAGLIFYADIFVPLFGFTLLWLARPSAHADRPVMRTSLASRN